MLKRRCCSCVQHLGYDSQQDRAQHLPSSMMCPAVKRKMQVRSLLHVQLVAGSQVRDMNLSKLVADDAGDLVFGGLDCCASGSRNIPLLLMSCRSSVLPACFAQVPLFMALLKDLFPKDGVRFHVFGVRHRQAEVHDPPKKTYDSLEAAVSLPGCIAKSVVQHLDIPRSISLLRRNGSSGRTADGSHARLHVIAFTAVGPACCSGFVHVRAGHLAAQDRPAL